MYINVSIRKRLQVQNIVEVMSDYKENLRIFRKPAGK
jgi:hypothetical protein